MTDKPYEDIPGTFVFDADRSREGVSSQPVLHINAPAKEPRCVQCR